MSDIEQALAEALRTWWESPPVDAVEPVIDIGYREAAAVILATPSMQAIARVVDAAVEWHEHKASIPSPAFLLDHAVTAMLGEPCSCGERCELVAAALGDDDE